jgi:predicted Rossmann fold nucleotide-binding protein DprA/Smf involved in DNA uptake
MSEALSADAKAILLLTAPLSVGRGKKSPDLLTPGEYKKLAQYLRLQSARPCDLLTPRSDRLLGDCHHVIDKARLERLLARGFLLSQAVERWRTRGIWVVSRADATLYPQRLKALLQEDAPAVLYGCGDRKILDSGGLAVVGSRNVDDALVEYTQGIGRLAASAGQTVVSGGARGIDQAAMRGALEAGGRATGVLADSLERVALERENRNMLLEGRLVLISPYDPGAGFNVGHAMQRNKAIYALADAALVVSADLNKGGTWAGATEQLKRPRSVPVFVRSTGAASAGLEALAKKGALPWPEPHDADALRAVITTAVRAGPTSPQQSQLGFVALPKPLEGAVRDAQIPESQPATDADRSADRPKLSPADELFGTVQTLVLRLVREPMKAAEIARCLGVSPLQAERWLKRLVGAGGVTKTDKPVRYVIRRSGLFEPEALGGTGSKAARNGSEK